MSDYKVIARKYRPQLFGQVIGQKVVVKTLLNALKKKRIGHAYLFSGTHGTGKTTIARLFSKALNCFHPTDEGEPCNECTSCKEIASSHSLDVLEIDGASNRGIEDIRKINETIGYSPSGHFKIYLIDEVHMLTKEAFNALLKSLEEPPLKVIFCFATTEPHKIPLTILSRCQHFSLARISDEEIGKKLEDIAADLKVVVERGALELIVRRAKGSLRDAESLFEQMTLFYDTELKKESVVEMLGQLSQETFFELDRRVQKKDISFGFQLAKEILASGKNVEMVIESLIDHFRAHLLFKKGLFPKVEAEKDHYAKYSLTYTEEGCLEILEHLSVALMNLKSAFSEEVFLEALLLKIFRISEKISLSSLVERLEAMEKRQKEIPSSKTSIHVEEKPVLQEKGEDKLSEVKKKSRYDTIMRFAAKELDGSITLKN